MLFCSLVLRVDPDGAVADFDWIAGDADFGDVDANTIVQLKFPLVPGAGDLAVADQAVMERGAAMGADIVDGKKTVRRTEEPDLELAERDATASSEGDLVQFERCFDVRHDLGNSLNFRLMGSWGKRQYCPYDETGW